MHKQFFLEVLANTEVNSLFHSLGLIIGLQDGLKSSFLEMSPLPGTPVLGS